MILAVVIMQLMQLHVREAWKKFRTSRGFELTHDLAIWVQFSSQLSYEATDVGSRSIRCSYVPMKEMKCEKCK